MAVFLAVAMTGVVFPLHTAHGEAYYWNGGDGGTWNTSNSNWTNASGTAVAWVDGKDAVFDSSAAKSLPVKGPVHADNILVSKGTQQLLFGDVGTLSWQGWAQHQVGGQLIFSCPLADNGNGLHFNVRGHTYLRRANSHTGGTYIKNSNSGDTNMRAFAINGATFAKDNPTGNDLALGPVPDTVKTNLIIKGGNVALFVDTSFTNTIHKNRTIFIEDNQTFFVNPNGKIDIMGSIVGANAGSTAYPTATRLHAHNTWSGLTVLHGTNYFGKLQVSGRLEIADGQTRVVTSAKGTSEDAALWVCGNNGSYSPTRGYLLVSGGEIVNSQNDYRFQTSKFGHIDIAGGQVRMNYVKDGDRGEFLNALESPGKTTIRDGGLLKCSKFRLSQTSTGNGGELFLEQGGTLQVRWIGLDFKRASKGIVHFNGGTIQSLEGNSNTSVTEYPNTNMWENCEFRVEAGGAVFDTSNNHHLWFGRPLVSGVTEGETDGGVICKIANGRAVVFHDSAHHSYTGPTRVEAAQKNSTSSTRTLQCRTANALPAATTLQIGPMTRVGFSDWISPESNRHDLAQTVARVEGVGEVFYNSLLTVTGGVKPSFDGTYGTLKFTKSGTTFSNATYDIAADTNGCGLLRFSAAGQDISGLVLNVDFSKLDRNAPKNTYKILDAPNGYTGRFQPGNVVGAWRVDYTATGAFLRHENGTMMIFR